MNFQILENSGFYQIPIVQFFQTINATPTGTGVVNKSIFISYPMKMVYVFSRVYDIEDCFLRKNGIFMKFNHSITTFDSQFSKGLDQFNMRSGIFMPYQFQNTIYAFPGNHRKTKMATDIGS